MLLGEKITVENMSDRKIKLRIHYIPPNQKEELHNKFPMLMTGMTQKLNMIRAGKLHCLS